MAFSTNEDGIIKLWQQVEVAEPAEAVSSAVSAEPFTAMSVSVSYASVASATSALFDGFSVQYSPA